MGWSPSLHTHDLDPTSCHVYSTVTQCINAIWRNYIQTSHAATRKQHKKTLMSKTKTKNSHRRRLGPIHERPESLHAMFTLPCCWWWYCCSWLRWRWRRNVHCTLVCSSCYSFGNDMNMWVPFSILPFLLRVSVNSLLYLLFLSVPVVVELLEIG